MLRYVTGTECCVVLLLTTVLCSTNSTMVKVLIGGAGSSRAFCEGDSSQASPGKFGSPPTRRSRRVESESTLIPRYYLSLGTYCRIQYR